MKSLASKVTVENQDGKFPFTNIYLIRMYTESWGQNGWWETIMIYLGVSLNIYFKLMGTAWKLTANEILIAQLQVTWKVVTWKHHSPSPFTKIKGRLLRNSVFSHEDKCRINEKENCCHLHQSLLHQHVTCFWVGSVKNKSCGEDI